MEANPKMFLTPLSLLLELAMSLRCQSFQAQRISVGEFYIPLSLTGSMFLEKKVAIIGWGASAIEAVEYAVSGNAKMVEILARVRLIFLSYFMFCLQIPSSSV